MKNYNNISGESGILAYETGDKWIQIKFINGDVYLYSYTIPGEGHVEQMKILAEKGKGLSTYISKNVRARFEKKL